jgi:hypothetical protein
MNYLSTTPMGIKRIEVKQKRPRQNIFPMSGVAYFYNQGIPPLLEFFCHIFTIGKLREDVWDRRGLSISTKLKVYRATVIPTLLYASEIWTVYSRHARKLNRFHLNCLRRLLRIKYQILRSSPRQNSQASTQCYRKHK